ncbi:MAG: amino acid adenylation domain-containing protein [Clostridia bacterium]|nr:amino acid adenylation domain-containing protein [Clostridia bacterium]
MSSTILEYLEDTEKKFPEKIAYADLKEGFSFRELKTAAMKIGSKISEVVSPGNPIVVYMDKRAYNILAFWGVVYAGCFYVPIDSQMPAERIKLIFDTLQPSMILYDDITESKLHEINFNFHKLHYKNALESSINKMQLSKIRACTKSTDLLYVLFTSGSTGVPKGVTISHLAVMDFMEWICNTYKLNENTTLCNQAPFYFDASVPDLYIPLKTGATVYIPPKNYYTFPKKIIKYINENNINTLIWVPSALCNVVNCKALEIIVPSCVNLVIFCGEVMPCKHLNIWKKYLPNALYVNMYGPTEATYACMYYNIDRDFLDDEKLPLGRACENSKIILVNESNNIAVNGEIGEICILGQCLSHGYYNAPDKTSKVFVQNPINNKYIELMYRTGDLATVNDFGEIIFVGRKDFQIKRLGHRIELGEIENAILSVNEVEDACCAYNERTNEIIAVYTGKIDSNSLASSISQKLSSYMMPNRFVKLDTMPKNLNDKIDRVKIKKEYAED